MVKDTPRDLKAIARLRSSIQPGGWLLVKLSIPTYSLSLGRDRALSEALRDASIVQRPGFVRLCCKGIMSERAHCIKDADQRKHSHISLRKQTRLGSSPLCHSANLCSKATSEVYPTLLSLSKQEKGLLHNKLL